MLRPITKFAKQVWCLWLRVVLESSNITGHITSKSLQLYTSLLTETCLMSDLAC